MTTRSRLRSREILVGHGPGAEVSSDAIMKIYNERSR
jgi:hypothetical protein